MKHEILELRWEEISNMIHTRWNRFSKKEIDSLRGNLDDLTKMVRKVYGYAQGRAEQECHQFKLALRPLLITERTQNRKWM